MSHKFKNKYFPQLFIILDIKSKSKHFKCILCIMLNTAEQKKYFACDTECFHRFLMPHKQYLMSLSLSQTERFDMTNKD